MFQQLPPSLPKPPVSLPPPQPVITAPIIAKDYEQTDDGFTRKSYVPVAPTKEEREEVSGSVKDIAKNINIPIMGTMSRTQMLIEKKKKEEEERVRRVQQEQDEYDQRLLEAKRAAEEQLMLNSQ